MKATQYDLSVSIKSETTQEHESRETHVFGKTPAHVGQKAA